MYSSLSIKPNVHNTKVNILSIWNVLNNIREEKENIEIKSNHNNINANNNNSHRFLRNNSNISNNYNNWMKAIHPKFN